MKKIPNKLETTMHFHATPRIFEFAYENREKATETEALLWEALRRSGKEKKPYKFRRQHPISRYILDFYCHAKRLGVEIDGGYHLTEEQKRKDELRTEDLNRLGIRIVRFTNEEVLGDFEGVLRRLGEALEERGAIVGALPPDP